MSTTPAQAQMLAMRLGYQPRDLALFVVALTHRSAEGPNNERLEFLGDSVLNLAVAPEFRRRGIGGALLDAGLSALQRRRVEEVFLEVRESNHSAQALYLAYGFRAVGQRAAYYRNPREDALVLRLGFTGLA